MTNFMNRVLAKVSILALAFSAMFALAPAHAAQMNTRSDTMTRQKISEQADHTIVFTLPTGIDFDANDDGAGRDALKIDFPAGFTSSASGTWVVGDFTFNDGTARTVNKVDQGTGVVDVNCSAEGANDIGIAVDTDAEVFTIKPCGDGFTGSSGAATVTFTIDGTTTDGTLANPSSAGSVILDISMDDEAASNAHSGDLSIPILDDDQVTVTATVAETVTFDLDVGTTSDTDSNAAYTVALGTLTTGAVTSSDSSSINQIGMDISANASNGVVVQVQNANGANGLVSTSVTADDIDVTTGTMTAGTEGYAICVHEVEVASGTLRQATSGTFGTGQLTMDGDGSGTNEQATSTTCNATTHQVGSTNLSSTFQNIFNSNSAALNDGRAEVFVKAAIDNNTAAHDDYTDTLTFRATATF